MPPFAERIGLSQRPAKIPQSLHHWRACNIHLSQGLLI